MTSWLKLVAVAFMLPALAPFRILACAPSDVTTPGSPDNGMIFPESPAGFDPSGDFPKLSTEKTGKIPTRDGRVLRVAVELGDVLVITGESGQISYRASAEADPRDPACAEFLKRFTVEARETPWGAALSANVPWHPLHGRFNASLEIRVPRQYSIEVTTGGGSIEVQDINGRVSLTTSGGNIKVGHVGGADDLLRLARARLRDEQDRGKPALPIAARIETMGGHIAVGDVDGSLRAKTLGGHITTGDIRGDAILSTSGGQIEAGRIAGAATLDSGGGSIHVKSAGSRINADAASGGIVLREAGVPLRVFANSGSITAWLNTAADEKGRENSHAHRPRGISEIASSNGDVTIYIPRELEATIDALVEGGGHRIVADPALPVKIHYGDSEQGGRTIHGEGVLNGGGDVLHLKCVSGDIVLRLQDSNNFGMVHSGAATRGVSADSPERPNSSPEIEDPSDFADPSGFLAEIRRRIVESIWGGIPVDADELQKHLVHSVAPVYPEVARHAGIEGNVVLRASISPGGRVADLKVLDGPPILARAAAEAVQQWEYQPVRINGRPASVVTTLVVSFRLH